MVVQQSTVVVYMQMVRTRTNAEIIWASPTPGAVGYDAMIHPSVQFCGKQDAIMLTILRIILERNADTHPNEYFFLVDRKNAQTNKHSHEYERHTSVPVLADSSEQTTSDKRAQKESNKPEHYYCCTVLYCLLYWIVRLPFDTT